MLKLKSATISPAYTQESRLTGFIDVLVVSPTKLLQHIKEGNLYLRDVRWLVGGSCRARQRERKNVGACCDRRTIRLRMALAHAGAVIWLEGARDHCSVTYFIICQAASPPP